MMGLAAERWRGPCIYTGKVRAVDRHLREESGKRFGKEG